MLMSDGRGGRNEFRSTIRMGRGGWRSVAEADVAMHPPQSWPTIMASCREKCWMQRSRVCICMEKVIVLGHVGLSERPWPRKSSAKTSWPSIKRVSMTFAPL